MKETDKDALLLEARKLIEPFEWADDKGRECPWCHATCHTFSLKRQPRDNHRETCRFLAFFRATSSLAQKTCGNCQQAYTPTGDCPICDNCAADALLRQFDEDQEKDK